MTSYGLTSTVTLSPTSNRIRCILSLPERVHKAIKFSLHLTRNIVPGIHSSMMPSISRRSSLWVSVGVSERELRFFLWFLVILFVGFFLVFWRAQARWAGFRASSSCRGPASACKHTCSRHPIAVHSFADKRPELSDRDPHACKYRTT